MDDLPLIFFCYTDGSCKKSPAAPGGWGFHIRTPEGIPIEKYGSALKTDSETMELTAIAEALKEFPEQSTVTIFSDSKSIVELCEKKIPVFRRNGWKNVNPRHLTLLTAIDALEIGKKLKLTWTWIRSHKNNEGNLRADALASQGSRDAAKAARETETAQPKRTARE